MLLKLCVEQKTAYILLSTLLPLWQSPVQRRTYNLHCESKFGVRAEESTGLELTFGDKGMSQLVNSKTQSILCSSNTTSLGLGSPSVMSLPRTTEQCSMCFESAVLSLAFQLILFGMGWTQNSRKTGAFHI